MRSNTPILALAPMQDVTDLRFMRLISEYGNADVYFTESIRHSGWTMRDPHRAICLQSSAKASGKNFFAKVLVKRAALFVASAKI